MKNKLTYVFDLDGTLCTQENDYKKASPFVSNIKIVNKLHQQGHTIIIDTARGTETGVDWKVLTRAQLNDWGVEFDYLRCGNKFAADYYVDDRMINIKDIRI